MVWICCLIVICLMAGIAICRCALITIGMTLNTIYCGMRSGKREISQAVIKSVIGTSIGMTGKTRRTIIIITRYSLVMVIGLWI